MRKILLLLFVVVAGVTAFFVLYHPPIRLMPPPLLFQAGGERVFDIAPEMAGSEIELFYASSRLPVGPRDDRIYSVAPDWRLHLGKSTLRIGEEETTERAAGQAAQLKHFAGREAVVVLFVWPTAENFLRYARDLRTALGSAPQLADLIRLMAAHTDAAKVDVFTYSAGATVGSDGLALLGREDPATAARLGEFYHAAPDADFRSFVDDLADYALRAAG